MQPKRQRPQSIKDFLELLNKPEREDITIIAKKEKLPPQKQPSSSNKLPIFIGVVVALLLATVVWFTQKPSDTTPLKEEAFATEVIPTENNPVDLGLSVKWAAYNVGASSPEEYGGLYGWADPTGEKKQQIVTILSVALPLSTLAALNMTLLVLNGERNGGYLHSKN